jgi:hypothetical protein
MDSASLIEESKRTLEGSDPKFRRMIDASVRCIFEARIPEAKSIKTTTHVRRLENSETVTALEWFFPEHAKDMTRENISVNAIEEGGTTMILCFNTSYGNRLWIVAQCSTDGMSLAPIEDPSLGCGFAVLVKHTRSQSEASPFLILTHVDPNICTHCDGWRHNMLKCKACWELKHIRVRYCSKECQLAHYPVHKGVCKEGE